MRQNTNPDQIYVGDFKGMATSGGTYGANPEYFQSLTNATVTKDGTVKARKGSRGLYFLNYPSASELFKFSFAGYNWLIHRFGTDFSIYLIQEFFGEPYNTATLCTKTGVLRTASANEPATYAVKTDGEYCHILIATKSTQLVSISLTKRDVNIFSTTATVSNGSYGRWFTSVLSLSNTKLIVNNIIDTGLIGVSTTGANSQVTFTWSTKPASVVAGSKVTMISCFWLRYVDSNFYSGNQLYGTGLRRNTVALDVNVPVPEELANNPIFNEPLQNLNNETYYVYNETIANATRLTRVTNRQPLTNNTWDFSDGSYRATTSQLTNRTPSYIAFGGLETGNVNNRINIARLREVLPSNFEYPQITDFQVQVDKVSNVPRWHNASTAVITTGAPRFFSYTSAAGIAPGVNLDSVVEIILHFNAAGANASFSLVDISVDIDRHTIGDGFCVPLYGYSLISSTLSFSFPSIVRIVGNRLLLTGNTNKILVSSTDWNYRGFTFTNCQVSTLNFSENSPYLLRVDQTGATVTSVESVNGVVLVFTESGIYRVTGKTRNEPPNAISAISSKLSNQIVMANCCTVVDNTVYFANKNGMYIVNYASDQDDGFITELSLPVNDLFLKAPIVISYSSVLDSILVKITGMYKLLRFSLLTKTWSYIHVAVPYMLDLFQTFDGYMFSDQNTQMVCTWSVNSILDIDATFPVPYVVPANIATVNTTATATPVLVSPPELMGRFIPAGTTVLPTYDGKARAVGSAVVVTETAASNSTRPILSSAVTKSLYTDKIVRALRLRNITLFAKGGGLVDVVVTGVNSENSVSRSTRHEVAIDFDGKYQVRASNEKNHNGFPTGDTVAVRLNDLGVSEAFNIGFAFTQDLEIVGFALDTSAKSLSRLT